MRTDAVAIQLTGWRVLPARWLGRVLPVVLSLVVAALVVQPPAQSAPGVPAKADPVLYAQAAAHPSQTYSVILRETVPSSTAAEDLVKSLGGHVTHELSIV